MPVEGASHNGMSNYCPRVSPDGRWIVFAQSPSGILLQPESQLIIIPAEGGTPRRMRCNRPRMTSWHSWSPNGKWLVFTSKENSPATELYLTHVDENGNDSVPVLLHRLSDRVRAANLPEFVALKPNRLERISFSAP